MEKTIGLDDVGLNNKAFWTGFIATSFPTAWDEENDRSLVEIIEENELADSLWWDDFTGYYEGILDENDGYLDEPTTLSCALTDAQALTIAFHPGDTVYYVNDRCIGSTGPHYEIGLFTWQALLGYVEKQKDKRSFLLLLPLVIISEEEAAAATAMIAQVLAEIFASPFHQQLAQCIIGGLMAE